jgi:predicted site-specific integrase-resolvase
MEHDNSSQGQPAEYLTPRQVSCLLQIPTTTLAVWRCTGRVRLAYVKVGRAVRYLRADVDHLIATSRRP